MSNNQRLSLYNAITIEKKLRPRLHDLCKEYWLAGSIRREQSTVGDIELVILPHNPDALRTRLDNMLDNGVISQALYRNSKRELSPRWGDKLRCFKWMDATVELHIVDQHRLGYKLWLTTGPADPNHYIMSLLSRDKSPLRFNDGYGWLTEYEGDTPIYKHKLSIPTEEILFRMLNLPFVFPQWRSESFYKSNWKGTMSANQLAHYIVKEPKQRKLL